MLRAAVKHGISNALSTRTGFEVWDFDITEEQPSPGTTVVGIKYRYHPSLTFVATIEATADEGGQPAYRITAEAVPGEVGQKEQVSLSGRSELFAAVERWTARIEEELYARPLNRVLAAQQKAISYLEKHLLDIPDNRMTRERVDEYRRRLRRLQTAVVAIRARPGEPAAVATERAEAVREEFECLHTRVEVLGERSFLHAVLVRLVKYFWDDENLRIVEAGSRAAQDFLRKQEQASAPAASPAPAAATTAKAPAPGGKPGPVTSLYKPIRPRR